MKKLMLFTFLVGLVGSVPAEAARAKQSTVVIFSPPVSPVSHQ